MTSGRTVRALATLVAVGLSVGSPARAGDGVVALQTADPSCANDTGDIYVACGNGTITDNRTGLVWLRNADCLGAAVKWKTAMDFVAGLKDISAGSDAAADDCGLSDGSSPGEWRLPSAAEWEDMVSFANGGPTAPLNCDPTISDDQGTACWNDDPVVCFATGRTCSFNNIRTSAYWSSTTDISATTGVSLHAWYANLAVGFASFLPKASNLYVWPVRGGQ